MRNLSRPLIILVLLFAAMFLINFVVMYVLFDINIISPIKRIGIYDNSKSAKELVKAKSPTINENGNNTEDDQIFAEDEAMASEQAADDSGLLMQETANEADSGYEAAYYMTSEEVGLLVDLSLSDKLEALSIISSIGKEDADKIYDMALDGVTTAEMDEIRGILEEHLSQQDMDTLNEILAKNKMLYAGQNARNN